MFRIEKFHVEYQLELYQVLRFRSIFTQNCVHFIVTYHVFLIQYPTSSVSYNISLESSLHIYASFEQIWILHFVKSNILGGESSQNPLNLNQNKTTEALPCIFSDSMTNYSSGRTVRASDCGSLDPRFESRRKLFWFFVGLKIVSRAFEKRLLNPLILESHPLRLVKHVIYHVILNILYHMIQITY